MKNNRFRVIIKIFVNNIMRYFNLSGNSNTYFKNIFTTNLKFFKAFSFICVVDFFEGINIYYILLVFPSTVLIQKRV